MLVDWGVQKADEMDVEVRPILPIASADYLYDNWSLTAKPSLSIRLSWRALFTPIAYTRDAVSKWHITRKWTQETASGGNRDARFNATFGW
jgi:hypothetical protein